MNKFSNKQILTCILIIIVLIGLFYLYWDRREQQRMLEGTLSSTGQTPGIFFPSDDPRYISPVYPSDLSVDNDLIGAAHNVFVGKAIAQTGNKETEIGPRTQYQVAVVDNIKGDLVGSVTIDMLGGYDKDGKLVVIEGEDILKENTLLEIGSTYLFATRYNQQENWYTIIGHPNGSKLLTKDSALSNADLSFFAKQDLKYKAWEKAYAEEVLLAVDIANNNTLNSFQSLPPEAKAAAQSRADAAKASLDANDKAQ